MIKAIKQNGCTLSGITVAGKTRRGFTLIELVVVIAIILLLLSLVMAVGLSARSQAEKREMQNILLLVDQAIKEWELVAARKLSLGGGIGSNPQIMVQLDQALARIQRVDSVRQILTNIDSDFLQQIEVDDGNGNNITLPHLVDPWGTTVYLIYPGSIDMNLPPDDIDGTVRTVYENEFGIAVNRTLLLVSAGPDGDFGNLDADSPDYNPKPAADNIYSYRPETIE